MLFKGAGVVSTNPCRLAIANLKQILLEALLITIPVLVLAIWMFMMNDVYFFFMLVLTVSWPPVGPLKIVVDDPDQVADDQRN